MGRPKGAVNKVTKSFRETIQRVLDANHDNVSKWLETVAAEDPGKALDLVAKLAEYAAPKLARTELVGDADRPVKFEVVAPWMNENVAKRN